MIPKECKRLAEVDFPVAKVSSAASAEKEGRIGHIPKIHVWPASRPTGACRAVLLALLLPDPCDPACPADFANRARNILHPVQGKAGSTSLELRQELLRFVGVFANWSNAANQAYLDAARALVVAAHGEEAPLLVDPFAGGGAIPLEALRVGCDVLSSDLNPVACLIQRAVLQDIPRVGALIADQLREVAAEIETAAKTELQRFYPKEANGAMPIAYLWARAITCDSCGADVPLLRSFWLCRKGKRRIALRCSAIRHPNVPPELEFEVFYPKNDSEVPLGSVKRAKATCLACHLVMSPDRVRTQLSKQNGGCEVEFSSSGKRVSGARLLAVVSVDEKARGGRNYRVAQEADYEPVRRATEESIKRADDMPREPLPPHGTLGFRVQLYGMTNWGQLFTARQKIALSTIAKLGCAKVDDPAIRNLFALCFSKMVDMNNSLTSWQPHAEIPAHMLTRFAVPMKWDFAEAVPISDSSGTIESATRRAKDVIPHIAKVNKTGQVQVASAVQELLPPESAAVWFTDPPYYDAVPYADISDFFLVWLKKILLGDKALRDPYDSTNTLSPKNEEIVQDESRLWKGHTKDKRFFEEQMSVAFAQGRKSLLENGIGCVVFAHKTTEGWEALLSGMVNGGWTITGSWPLSTEMSSRLRARE
jgi:putative DNA methylase